LFQDIFIIQNSVLEADDEDPQRTIGFISPNWISLLLVLIVAAAAIILLCEICEKLNSIFPEVTTAGHDALEAAAESAWKLTDGLWRATAKLWAALWRVRLRDFSGPSGGSGGPAGKTL
jgi:hypothetical protein